jgi:hypothetical protein
MFNNALIDDSISAAADGIGFQGQYRTNGFSRDGENL